MRLNTASIISAVETLFYASAVRYAVALKILPYRFHARITSRATTCPEIIAGGTPGPGTVNCPV